MEAVEDFTLNGSLLPDHLSPGLTDRQFAGRKWLMEHSEAADSVSARQIEQFARRFE